MIKIPFFLYSYALLLLLLSACARLPDYARPHFSLENEAVSLANSFPYRALRMEDFRADALPPSYQQFNHTIQARSCISIQTSKAAKLYISSGTISEKTIYTGTFSDLSFIAVFNPDCSWWNPKIADKNKNYILQHEQIHFALTELTARKLNRDYSNHMKEYLAIGNTAQEVKDQLHAEAERISQEGLQQALAEHTSFDEETSLFYDPEIQQRWAERVLKELNSEETP